MNSTSLPRLFTHLALASILALSPIAGVAQQGPPDYSSLFEDARKSVVSVNSLTLQERGARPFPFPFPFPFPGQPPQSTPDDSPHRTFGFGSGVVLDIEGHIITNAHVILDNNGREVDNVEIVMFDKKKHNAKIIGFDIYTDIALLKIDPPANLAVAKIGNSDILKVGQGVLALGHPLGLDYTLTSGIISSLKRSLLGNATDRHVPFIQTDAVINPGNSGGPLLNASGEVIGINARIISGRGGNYIGYSLAIPINEAMEVQRTLRTDGKIERGMLGVTFEISGISEDDAKVWGLNPDRGGVLINSIIEGSGAEAADLKAGDIILEYDGLPLQDPANFPRHIANTKPGTKVQVTYFREGVEKVVQVTIGSINDGGQLAAIPSDGGKGVKEEPYGMVLQAVPDKVREDLGIKSGVLLTGFNEQDGKVKTPQELFKLQSGDVILGVIISGKLNKVDAPNDLRALLTDLTTDTIGFQVKRNRSRPFFLTVNLSN